MPSTICLGSVGDDVRRLQRVLARYMLWNPFGPITGPFDASLETAEEFSASQWLDRRRDRGHRERGPSCQATGKHRRS
jgi:hypothetical protein